MFMITMEEGDVDASWYVDAYHAELASFTLKNPPPTLLVSTYEYETP